MRHLLKLVVLGLTLGVTVSCGTDERPDTTPDPTTRPSASAAAGTVDVCGLIPSRLRARVDPGRDFTTKLSYGSEGYVSCGQPGTVTVEYGYRVAGPADVPDLGEYVSRVKGLGDAAVLEKRTNDATLWVRRGDVLVRVRNDKLRYPGAEQVTLATQRAVAESLLARATTRVVDATEPIDLGPSCPAATDAVVTDLTGPVVTARGGRQSGDEQVECQYLGAAGTRISLDRLVQDGAEKEFFDPSYQKMISWSQVRKAWVEKGSSPGMVALDWSTASDTLWSMDVSPRVGSADYGKGRATLEGAKALGRAVMTRNPTP